MPPLTAALDAVRRIDLRRPPIGIVLGSGLGGVADEAQAQRAIPYGEVPGMPGATVPGHAGRLVIGEVAGHLCALLQGRAHFYEGNSMQQAAFGVRLLGALGVETLILTNAAGGINPVFAAGDVMLIRDHIFLPGMAGFHPLRGPNDDHVGPRFPAMVDAYDPDLRRLARHVAGEQGVPCHEGVYTMVSGPSYETSAELRLLRSAGAVGMSTCPETVVARHAGMRVLGLSLIANLALPDRPEILTHEAVVAASAKGAQAITTLLTGILRRL